MDAALPDACTKTTYYKDADHDGYGHAADSISSCEPVGNYTATGGTDCCDADPNVFPGQSSYWGEANACGNHDYNCDQLESTELPMCDACPAAYTGACWSPSDSAPRYPTCGDVWDRRVSCSSFLSTTNQWVKCR